MLSPGHGKEASPWNRLLARLADSEGSRLKPFKSGSDFLEFLQLLTTAVEANRLIIAELGFIFSANVVQQFRNIDMGGTGSENSRLFGNEQRTEGFRVGGGFIHDTGSGCNACAKTRPRN